MVFIDISQVLLGRGDRMGGIGTEESFTVEVNQVGRRIGYPNLRFPCDCAKVAAHDGAVRKRGHVNESGRRSSKQAGKLRVSLSVNRAVAGDRFHKDQPVLFGVVQNHVWHFAVCVHVNAKFGEQDGVEVAPFLAGISRIDEDASGNETRPEILDNGPDQFAMLAGAEIDFLAGCYLHGNQVLLALVRVLRGECLTLREVRRQLVVPRVRVEAPQECESGRPDLVDGCGAVHGPVGFIGVVEGDACVNKLVHGLSAHGFASVRRVDLLVVVPNPIHDRRDAHERVLRFGPFPVEPKIEQGQKAKSGSLVLLLAWQAKRNQDFMCIVEVVSIAHSASFFR